MRIKNAVSGYPSIEIINGILKLIGHLQRLTGNQFITSKKKKKAFRLLILHELQQLVTRWSVREASLYSIISANKCRAEFHALKKAPE